MPDEEPAEFDTPWRRSLDEIEPALSAWALARFAEPVAVANVASPGNGMSSETVLFDVHNVAEGGVDHYVARLAPLPDLYPVFPDYDLELQRKCMDLVRAHTDVPAPEVAFFERDTEWLRHTVPRDAPHRRRGAARHPALRVRRLGDGRVARATAHAAGRDASSVLARLHEITPVDARSVVPRAAAARHERARPATRIPALVLRVGAQRRVVPVDRAHARVARRQPPARRRRRCSTGATRGSATCSTSTSSRSRCSTGRWPRSGPREVDLAWMIFLDTFFDDLAAALRDARARRLHGPRRRRGHLRTADRPHACRRSSGSRCWPRLRFAIVSVRTSTRGIAYGQMEPPDEPDDLIMFRSLLERMLER